MSEAALIVGAGEGLSASLARLFAAEGMQVAVAARNADKLAPLASAIGGHAFACDVVDADAVDRLFEDTVGAIGVPDVDRVRTLISLPDEVRRRWHGADITIDNDPIVADGEVELRHWVREQAVSRTEHRHGRLIERYRNATHSAHGQP